MTAVDFIVAIECCDAYNCLLTYLLMCSICKVPSLCLSGCVDDIFSCSSSLIGFHLASFDVRMEKETGH